MSSVLFYNTALFTRGNILDFAPNDAFLSPDHTPIIAFVDFRGQKQLGTPESALGMGDAFAGQEVTIGYNPDNPRVFRVYAPLSFWGPGVLALLYGLVPFLGLSFLIAVTKQAPRIRAASGARAKDFAVKPIHLMRHKVPEDTSAPAVRRMR